MPIVCVLNTVAKIADKKVLFYDLNHMKDD